MRNTSTRGGGDGRGRDLRNRAKESTGHLFLVGVGASERAKVVRGAANCLTGKLIAGLQDEKEERVVEARGKRNATKKVEVDVVEWTK